MNELTLTDLVVKAIVHIPIYDRFKRISCLDMGMSNCDHTIDRGLAKRLRGGRVFAQHSAWNFCGYVWFENGQYHEEVMVHHQYQETIHAKSLKELMQKVNDIYGWE